MNGLDLGKKALALFRQVRGNESLDQQCQRMSGYYTQWAYQGNETGIKVYPSANAAWAAAPKDGTNINQCPVGGFFYWNIGKFGHVGMCIGYDGNRALVLHTGQKGDTVLALDPFWRVSHADSYPFPFRNWSYTNGANPRMTVAPWSPNPEPGPKQRKVVAAGSNARTEPRAGAAKVKVLAPNSLVDMQAFTDAGEAVNGNSRWFKTAEGHWAWSGGFTSADKANLTDLTPPPPPVKYAVVFDDGVTAKRTVEVEAGKLVPQPQAPSRAGFTFAGWNDSPGKPYNFSTPVTAALTLIAAWTPVLPPAPAPVDPDKTPGWFTRFVQSLVEALTKFLSTK